MAKLEIKGVEWNHIEVAIEGIAPGLLMHRRPRVPYKVPKEPLDSDLIEEARLGLYMLSPERDGCLYGVPGLAFSNAMFAVTKTWASNQDKAKFRQGTYIETGPDGYVPLVLGTMTKPIPAAGGELIEVPDEQWAVDVRQATVQRNSIWRARALFGGGWRAVVPIAFNTALLRAQDVITVLNSAGESIGVGDFRMEKHGPFGRFRVVNG